MKLSEILRPECIDVAPRVDDKQSVLRRIVEVAKRSSLLETVSHKEILMGLEEREALGSTAFGKGIAIPHCRLESVAEFVVGIITIPSGVDFKASDGERTRLVFFIIAPARKSQGHLRLLSVISQTLMARRALRDILAEKTSDGVRNRFLAHTRTRIDTETRSGRCLVQVAVQDEEMFREIAQVLVGLVPDSAIVFNAEHLAGYLSKIPLFAALLGDEKRQVTKMIHLVVDHKLVNETIRAIESVTGDLDGNKRVMVVVQELAHVAGSLSESI